MTGREIVIDDAWFEGCFHDAFEGEVEEKEEGSFHAGKQGIQRTKGILTGAGSEHSAMTLNFQLDKKPTASVKLEIIGLDDAFDAQNRIVVKVNDTILTEELRFPNNRHAEAGINNDRYYVGWSNQALEIPADTLRDGANTISIANATSCFDSPHWNYIAIDKIQLIFQNDATLELQRKGSEPVLYYGLNEGPEVNAWPAVNLGNRLCLIEKTPLQVHFFITVPHDKPLGNGEPLAEQAKTISREILLHLETDADVGVLTGDGQPVKVENKDGKQIYTVQIPRLNSFETPHPAQGVPLFLRGGKPFESKQLEAWVSIDGIPYRKTVYTLRNISIKPLKDRQDLDFDLGIWGGGIPEKSEETMREYITTVKNTGFNQLFTGKNQVLNTMLKDVGFQVYARYGWFGHQFKVTEDLSAFAAIDSEGKPMEKDFCPLAILENEAHPEIGKFFQRARESAQQKDIDGICVDYETAPVWCYCERCLAKFQGEDGIKITGRKDVIPGAVYADAFADYGRRRNRDLLAKVKEIMKKENPHLKYHSLASASDVPSYWYDGRMSARHSVRELTTFADAIYASCYFYEIPGGMKSVIPIIRTISGYAHDSERDVDTYIISPVATTISEFPRYRGTWMQPDFTKLLIQLAGIGGAHGVLLFRGDCFDGEYFSACQDALKNLLALRPYIKAGIDRSYEVGITPLAGQQRVFQTEVAEHLLARLMWHPSEVYEYDAVQLLKDTKGTDRLVAIFNFSSQPKRFRVAVHGLFDSEYKITDFSDNQSLGTLKRLELESGRLELEVPARSGRFIRLEAPLTTP